MPKNFAFLKTNPIQETGFACARAQLLSFNPSSVSCRFSWCRCGRRSRFGLHCKSPIVMRLRGNDKSAFSRYSRGLDRNFDRIKVFFLKKIVAFEWICIRIANYWNFRELSNSQFHPPELPSGFKGLNLASRWNRWLFVHSRACNWKLRRKAALRDLHSRCVLIHLIPRSLYFGSSSPRWRSNS
jgi:hypothetical protein